MSDRTQTRIDFLIRSGLAANPDKLAWYRKVFADPEKSVKDFNLREPVGDVLERLLHLVFSDDVIYNRIRTLLLRRKSKSLSHKMSEESLLSLVEKSVEFDVPVDVLIDVYQRGFLEEGRNIPADQNAFNRVNSFLSGGKALELDRDILDEYFIDEETKKKKVYNPVLNTVSKVLKHSFSNPDKGKKPPVKKKKK